MKPFSKSNFFKGFIHRSGEYMPMTENDVENYHHSNEIAINPQKFGTTEEALKNAISRWNNSYVKSSDSYNQEDESASILDDLKTIKSVWNTPVIKQAALNGFNRLIGDVRDIDAIDMQSKIPVKAKHHIIDISDDSLSSSIEDFKNPVESTIHHLHSVMGPHDTMEVKLSGFRNLSKVADHLKERNIKQKYHGVVAIDNMEDLHKLVDKPYKRNREPEAPVHIPTSSQILKNMGQKPEEMPTVQWNLIRRIGDSYEPTKFNTLLEKIGAAKKGIVVESGGRRILGANPLQLTSDGLRRHLNKFSRHIAIEEGGKHYIVRDKDGNVIHTFTKGRIGPKAALGALTIVRDHLEKMGVYTREKNESEGVGRKKRQNVVVDDDEISPEEKQKAEESRLSAKRDWLKTILSGRLKEKKRGRLEAKQKRIEKALARTKKLQSTNPNPEQQQLRQYK